MRVGLRGHGPVRRHPRAINRGPRYLPVIGTMSFITTPAATGRAVKTTTALTASPSPATVAKTVTLTATVTAADGSSPAGSVQIRGRRHSHWRPRHRQRQHRQHHHDVRGGRRRVAVGGVHPGMHARLQLLRRPADPHRAGGRAQLRRHSAGRDRPSGGFLHLYGGGRPGDFDRIRVSGALAVARARLPRVAHDR